MQAILQLMVSLTFNQGSYLSKILLFWDIYIIETAGEKKDRHFNYAVKSLNRSLYLSILLYNKIGFKYLFYIVAPI
jgi:hypothetical protein